MHNVAETFDSFPSASPRASTDGAGRTEATPLPPGVAEETLRLAGLLAHEANSPAAAIVAFVDFLSDELRPPPGTLADALKHMRSAAMRVTRVLAQTQQVARSPGRFGFVRLTAVMAAFDRYRPRPSVRDGRAAEVEVVAEPGPLFEALSDAGAAMPPGPVRVSVSSKGVIFTGGPVAEAPTPPPWLAERGATCALEGGLAVLVVPFRLLGA